MAQRGSAHEADNFAGLVAGQTMPVICVSCCGCDKILDHSIVHLIKATG